MVGAGWEWSGPGSEALTELSKTYVSPNRAYMLPVSGSPSLAESQGA